MAGKTTAFDTSLLQLIFNATTIANVAQNASSAPITSLYVSLHTASPGVGGNQTTNEVAYSTYARVAVARTTGGWTVTSGSVSPVSTIVFPAANSGGDNTTATYFGIGSATSGAGTLLYFGTISPNINIVNGVTPQLTTGSTITES